LKIEEMCFSTAPADTTSFLKEILKEI